VPVSEIKERSESSAKQKSHWFIWLLLGSGVIILILFLLRKQKEKKGNKQN
jgi:hypothetical protein